MTEQNNLIVETALDSLTQVLAADCSWIQLAKPFCNQLNLVSYRNFTHEMYHEMSRMDMNHYFTKEVVGLGNKVIIPKLSMNGRYGLAVFKKAGFHSLVGVPITTYRVLGITGVAYKSRKRFNNDFPELLAVIAKLIGMGLNKNSIIENKARTDNSLHIGSEPGMKSSQKVDREKHIDVINDRAGINHTLHVEGKDGAFQKHVHMMDRFRREHK